ncbi:hypothetical protein FH968_02925 [Buttiauxella sp. B2]|nr:hypothetical protein FH968_02925 [Buttiauxella sp. B2]
MILKRKEGAVATKKDSSKKCENDKVSAFVNASHGHVVQVLKSDHIYSGSSIFFHYLSDSDEHPDVQASFAPNRCTPQNNITFDSFSFDGSAANIESVFWGKGQYKQNLFIIVGWIYNLDEVSTVGKYYNVFAYDYDQNKIVKNDKLSGLFEGGQDGLVDGKSIKYKFKTAGDVWSYLGK